MNKFSSRGHTKLLSSCNWVEARPRTATSVSMLLNVSDRFISAVTGKMMRCAEQRAI